MNDVCLKVLRDLVERHPDAVSNVAICRALLLDYCGTYKRECAALIGALEAGIPAALRSGPGSLPRDVWLDELVERLVDRAMSQEAGEWAVTRWAQALGVPVLEKSKEEVREPEPEPKEPPVDPAPIETKLAPEPEKGPTKQPPIEPADKPKAKTTGKVPSRPSRKARVALWALIAVCAVLFYVLHGAGPKVKSFEFFEGDLECSQGGNPAVGPAHFRQDQTRAICFDLSLARPVRQDTTIDELWRSPGGAAAKQSVKVTAGQANARDGRGYDEVDHFEAGTWNVDMSISGKELDTKQFVIEAMPVTALNLKSIRLFAKSGASLPPLADRIYRTHFWQDATRDLDFEIDFASLAPRHVKLRTVMWRPSPLPQTSYTTVWDITGTDNQMTSWWPVDNWPIGDYRVDFHLDGVTIASKKFTMEAPLGAQSFRLDADNPNQDLITLFPGATTFSTNLTRMLWFKLTLSRPVSEATPMMFYWHGPNGTEGRGRVTLKAGDRFVKAGFGSPRPGSLIPGSWRVECFLDNKQLATESFQMVEQSAESPRLKPSTGACCDCGPQLSDLACFRKCNALLPRCNSR